jgi:hypothetical protein
MDVRLLVLRSGPGFQLVRIVGIKEANGQY